MKTNEIIEAREHGALDKLLPSGTEIPFQFSNGEHNVLVVGRDASHTFLITKYVVEDYIFDDVHANAPRRLRHCGDTWAESEIRHRVHELYEMMPDTVKRICIPFRERETLKDIFKVMPSDLLDALKRVQDPDKKPAERPPYYENEDLAFLLSAANVVGDEYEVFNDQIDIFRNPENRPRRRSHGEEPVNWWWTRTTTYMPKTNMAINRSGNPMHLEPMVKGGVIFAVCIEEK